MPVIRVSGLPQTLFQTNFKSVLTTIRDDIKHAVLEISELELSSPEQVSVFFPIDGLPQTANEFIVEIFGLLERPERSREIRERLAASVGNAVHKHYPKSLVESLVTTQNPIDGFWSSLGK
jgi:hypothetical protein